MNWQTLNDLWQPLLGIRAEERARNLVGIFELGDPHSKMIADLGAGLAKLNEDRYRFADGIGTVKGEFDEVSTETIATCVAVAMHAWRQGQRAKAYEMRRAA